MKISKQLAPVRPGVNCFGYGNKKLYLTIHQTGNASRGANAKMHAKLQSRVYGASWHYTVDDKEAIQSFEHGVSCWHSSDGRGNGNLNSIAIEGCINVDGNYVQSVKNMAELAARILKQENIPISNMKQHHDWDIKNRKNCPTQIRAGKAGINWALFIQMVKDNMNDKPVTKPQPTKSISTLVNETKKGLHRNGEARKKSLGSNYDAVMNVINGGAKPKIPQVKVDGYLGKETIKSMQRYFGTPVDGKLSKPSLVIKKLQAKIGTKVDGYLGYNSIVSLQRYLKTPVDGKLSKPSVVIKELQRRLNSNNL